VATHSNVDALEDSFDSTDGVSNRVGYVVKVAATNGVGTGPTTTSNAVTPSPEDPVEEFNAFALAGTDLHLYSRLSTQSTYGNLGGIIFDAPGLAFDPNSQHSYAVVRGAKVHGNNLYIRSDTQGFVPFVDGVADCREPSAAIYQGTLSVACRGTNNHLYVARVEIPDTGLPTVDGFEDYGGVLLYGPSVITGNGTGTPFFYEVVGTNHHLFTRTDADGFTADTEVPMTCFGTVTENVNDDGDDVVACPAQNGALQGKLFTDQTPEDGVTGVLPGVVVGRPGVVVNGDGTVDVYVTGTDQRVYGAGFGSDGTPTGQFHAIGGAGIAGASAIDLEDVIVPAPVKAGAATKAGPANQPRRARR